MHLHIGRENLVQTITLSIDGMSCGHCVASVRGALGAVPGVEIRDVRIGAAELGIDDAAAPAIHAALAAVRDAGYDAALAPAGASLAPAPTAGSCCAPRPTLTPLSLARTR